MATNDRIDLRKEGYCPCCDKPTVFRSNHVWLRDYYKCSICGSIPRNRQLIKIVRKYFNNIAPLKVYEAGACGPSSEYLRKNVAEYTESQYWPDVRPGQKKKGVYCQDLESLTWPDELFDLVVTQDVMEHVFHPEKAFKEICRVLKPGGYHIFTVPIWKDLTKTVQRARMKDGIVEHLLDPVDHGGFLVTFDWSYDILDTIFEASGMVTEVYRDVDQYHGIEGEFLDLLVSKKLMSHRKCEKRLTNRKGVPMNRLEKIRFMLTKSMRGLEIGPSYSPVVPKSEGWMVETVDHATREELREKFRAQNVDIDKIEDVDWVWKGVPLDEMIGEDRWGTYDYVIASHVIEHTPDLLGFLKGIEHLLKDGGTLSLAIPDKRYCLDFFKPITSTADILYSNRKGAKRHTKKTAFEHIAYSCAQNGAILWGPNQSGQLGFVYNLEQAFNMFQGLDESEESAYADFHSWYFVPSSFLLIIEELRALGQTSFEVAETFPGEGCEFYVLLRKCAKSAIESREMIELRRLALMKQVMREIDEEKGRHIQAPDIESQNMALHIQNLTSALKEAEDTLGWMILSKFRIWRDKILRPNTTGRDIYNSTVRAIKYLSKRGRN